jgi:hypothetical protein
MNATIFFVQANSISNKSEIKQRGNKTEVREKKQIRETNKKGNKDNNREKNSKVPLINTLTSPINKDENDLNEKSSKTTSLSFTKRQEILNLIQRNKDSKEKKQQKSLRKGDIVVYDGIASIYDGLQLLPLYSSYLPQEFTLFGSEFFDKDYWNTSEISSFSKSLSDHLWFNFSEYLDEIVSSVTFEPSNSSFVSYVSEVYKRFPIIKTSFVERRSGIKHYIVYDYFDLINIQDSKYSDSVNLSFDMSQLKEEVIDQFNSILSNVNFVLISNKSSIINMSLIGKPIMFLNGKLNLRYLENEMNGLIIKDNLKFGFACGLYDCHDVYGSVEGEIKRYTPITSDSYFVTENTIVTNMEPIGIISDGENQVSNNKDSAYHSTSDLTLARSNKTKFERKELSVGEEFITTHQAISSLIIPHLFSFATSSTSSTSSSSSIFNSVSCISSTSTSSLNKKKNSYFDMEITFVCGEEQLIIPCHRCIVLNRSEFIQTLYLSSQFNDSSFNSKLKVLGVLKEHFDYIRICIALIYGCRVLITKRNIVSIFSTLKFLGALDTSKFIIDNMMKEIRADFFVFILNNLYDYLHPNSKETLIDVVADIVLVIPNIGEIDNIHVLAKILQSDYLRLTKDRDVIQLISIWVHNHPKRASEADEVLVPCLRFPPSLKEAWIICNIYSSSSRITQDILRNGKDYIDTLSTISLLASYFSLLSYGSRFNTYILNLCSYYMGTNWAEKQQYKSRSSSIRWILQNNSNCCVIIPETESKNSYYLYRFKYGLFKCTLDSSLISRFKSKELINPIIDILVPYKQLYDKTTLEYKIDNYVVLAERTPNSIWREIIPIDVD